MEAAVDPRLVAIGLATEVVIEFPAGTVEVDMLDAPPAEAAPLVPEPAPVATVAEPVVIRIEPAPIVEPLPESPVLLQTTVVHGLWPRQAELSLEELGLRIGGAAPVAIRWSDVTAIDVRRGRVELRTSATSLTLAVTVDGVEAPELSEAFGRVLSDAREGAFDPHGTSVHELQNAMDAVRDTFDSSDDAFIPLALGGAFGVLTVILAVAVPEALAFVTRPTVPPNAFVLGSRLAPFDPRVLAVVILAAALVTSLTARAALGPHATSWARGTLRGWHVSRPSVVRASRRALALVFLHPAIAGAALAVALAVAIPSARSHATVDAAGIHVVRPVPVFDRTATWKEVQEIVTLVASGADHPHGVAALIRFNDEGTVTTLDLPVHNSTDRYFLELTRKWHAQAVAPRR